MDLRYFLKGLVLPPFAQIILLLVAWKLRLRLPRLSRVVFYLAVFSLWMLATPLASTFLCRSLESDPALTPDCLDAVQADAIVVLSGGQNEAAPEFGEAVSSSEQLSRIRYGAFLHHRTGLPVLLSGGSVRGDEKRSLAETMAYDLAEGFGVKARWLESNSRTTAENASYSYQLLSAEKKTSIVLVTSSLHMMRARWSFERVGFKVLPAPTEFIQQKEVILNSFLPKAHSLQKSTQAIHEWLGFWTYQLLEKI